MIVVDESEPVGGKWSISVIKWVSCYKDMCVVHFLFQKKK
jgi:hypothetical protein